MNNIKIKDMSNKYYIRTIGANQDALVKCIKKAIELAEKDSETKRIVFYSYTKNNFDLVSKVLGVKDINKMFSSPLKFNGISVPLFCATKKTYTSGLNDIVICCHMDSADVFVADDKPFAKYIIGLSWTQNGLDEWIERWNAENLDTDDLHQATISTIEPLAKIAFEEMDDRMFNTKCMGHPNDEETCKTYIRAINKYLPSLTPKDLQNYLVTELSWTNENAQKVGDLLDRLKNGKTFKGGKKVGLKTYYTQWKKNKNK